jgi:hypothetical protein
MFVVPGRGPELGQTLTREVAQRIADNWWRLLLNGIVLIVAGVLIFSINWTVESLATFIGALFIFEGTTTAFTAGIDYRVRRMNVLTGLLSAATGVAIIVWPNPGLVAVAIFLGAWLIVIGTLSVSASFSARRIMPGWWLVLINGILEVILGVLALADPGATLAALITVGGIWAVAIGVMRCVTAFELRHLPDDLEGSMTTPSGNSAAHPAKPGRTEPAAV